MALALALAMALAIALALAADDKGDKMLHIYTTTKQPATRWVDNCGTIKVQGGWNPEDLLWCECCGKKRMAKNCDVQCYYDGMRIWCANGHGCKNQQAITAKRWKEHMNRSRAQQARWDKVRAAQHKQVKIT